MPIRILLADDHPVWRSGIRALLTAEPDFEVVAEAADGEETLHLVRTLGLATDALAAREGTPSVEARRLRGTYDEVQTVIGDVRSITEELRPPALGPFGLAAAVRAHADRYRRQHPGIAVELALDDDGQTLDEPVRLPLFRVVQEALDNAAKHGHPPA